MAAAAKNGTDCGAQPAEASKPACRTAEPTDRPTNAKESKPRSAVSRNLRAADKLEEKDGRTNDVMTNARP